MHLVSCGTAALMLWSVTQQTLGARRRAAAWCRCSCGSELLRLRLPRRSVAAAQLHVAGSRGVTTRCGRYSRQDAVVDGNSITSARMPLELQTRPTGVARGETSVSVSEEGHAP